MQISARVNDSAEIDSDRNLDDQASKVSFPSVIAIKTKIKEHSNEAQINEIKMPSSSNTADK